MTERNKEAYCGLYCGACPVYLKRPNDWIVETVLAQHELTFEELHCEGCRSDHLSPSCMDCRIRDCAQHKGLDSCAPCTEFPCQWIAGFRTIRPHGAETVPNLTAIREHGSASWLASQARHWACRTCGTTGSWYEQTCTSCGATLSAGWAKPES